MLHKVNERTADERLTPRESEVAKLVLRGHGNKVIARELGLKVGTVKIHVHNIYRKLGVPNRRVFLFQALTTDPVLSTGEDGTLTAADPLPA